MPACCAIVASVQAAPGSFVHGHQRARDARIGQAQQQARRRRTLLRMVEQPAQQLHQQHIEQAVGQQALATAHALGFGKQQRQGLLQTLRPPTAATPASGGKARTSGCCRPPSKSSVAQTKSEPSTGALWKHGVRAGAGRTAASARRPRCAAARRCRPGGEAPCDPGASTCRKPRPGTASKWVTPHSGPAWNRWAWTRKRFSSARQPVERRAWHGRWRRRLRACASGLAGRRVILDDWSCFVDVLIPIIRR